MPDYTLSRSVVMNIVAYPAIIAWTLAGIILFPFRLCPLEGIYRMER